jgi:phage shock protein C
MKKLYRSETDRVLAGVLGGLGEYLEIDATVLRLLYIFIAVVTGFAPAIIGYVVAFMVIPRHPSHHTHNHSH